MAGHGPVRYLLDTSFLIDYMRGDPPTTARFARLFEDGDAMFVIEVVLCDLASGVAPAEEGAMAALLEPLEFIQPGPETATTAGQWRRAARRRGATLSVPDALIAAAADALDAIVLTRNLRDFALTPARVEAY